MTDDVLARVDRRAMAHSLQVRVPLLDHTVIEIASRLPWSYKRRGGAQHAPGARPRLVSRARVA